MLFSVVMIDLDQLRIFHAVCEARSFTRAAQAVHLTQPGISKHIRQLEEHYGLPMFDRLGRRVELTAAGAELYQATRRIMQAVGDADRRIADLQGLRSGTVALGTSFLIGVYTLPQRLAAFRNLHPEITVTLEIALSKKIFARVLDGKMDLGLVTYKIEDPHLELHEFMRDELVAIAPPGHRWAHRRRVHPRELAGETLLMAARGAGTRAVLEERLARMGITPSAVLEFGNLEGVKRAVEAGLGVSVQARSCVEREIAAGYLVMARLAEMDTTLPSYLVRRRDRHLSNAARAFAELMGVKMGQRATAR